MVIVRRKSDGKYYSWKIGKREWLENNKSHWVDSPVGIRPFANLAGARTGMSHYTSYFRKSPDHTPCCSYWYYDSKKNYHHVYPCKLHKSLSAVIKLARPWQRNRFYELFELFEVETKVSLKPIGPVA